MLQRWTILLSGQSSFGFIPIQLVKLCLLLFVCAVSDFFFGTNMKIFSERMEADHQVCGRSAFRQGLERRSKKKEGVLYEGIRDGGWGYPNSWMVKVANTMTGGSPILGNPH